MEWFKDYWYLVIISLAAAMFIFGHRSNKDNEETAHDQQGIHTSKKTHKSGHSCCH